MVAYIWPMALVVIANTVYQICSKSIPLQVDPFASLTVTYLVGALVSLVLFFVTSGKADIVREISKMNWATVALGITVVALELGFIYAYRAGWQVSIAFIVQSAFLAVSLAVVGYFLYSEALTWNKLAGIAVCLAGLVILNLK